MQLCVASLAPAVLDMTATDHDELDRSDMARLAAGQDAALDDLMARHAERLFHYLVRALQDEGDAADLAQETFVKVYQHRARYDPRQKFSTWLYAIACNLVRDRYRWRARHPQVSLDAQTTAGAAGLKETLTARNPTPDQELQTQERAEAVRQAVAELPEELREALLLAEYEDKSYAEIAQILGCSAKAVEMRLYRARQQLRGRLEKLLR